MIKIEIKTGTQSFAEGYSVEAKIFDTEGLEVGTLEVEKQGGYQ